MKNLSIILVISCIVLFYTLGLHHELSLERIQDNLTHLKSWERANPLEALLIFFGAYLFLTTLSIPGAIVLTLLAGAIWGTAFGTLLVCLASSLGATLSFLLSRYLFTDVIRERLGKKFHFMLERLNHEGNRYLFSMRLIPVSPYLVINVIMGLTKMRALDFFWITILGMFPGNLIYVYAGRKLSSIESTSEILSPQIVLLLCLLGLIPFLHGFVKRRSSKVRQSLN